MLDQPITLLLGQQQKSGCVHDIPGLLVYVALCESYANQKRENWRKMSKVSLTAMGNTTRLEKMTWVKMKE